MIEEKGLSFLETFMKNPKQVCLLGTKGKIQMYVPYIKLLRKNNIEPYAIVSNQEGLIQTKILGVDVISYDEWSYAQKKEQYVLLTSSARRFKIEDIAFIRNCSFTKGIHVWSDFPFQVNFSDYPFPRNYSESGSWFYDVLYSGLKLYDKNPQKYIEEVFQHNGLTIKAGAFVMQDYHSKYVNITNGERFTANQPDSYENDVYILGSCIAYGDRCDDETTIASKLQSLLNKEYNSQYCVHNYGAIQVPINNLICLLKTLDLKCNDSVFFIDMPRLMIEPDSKCNARELALIYTDYLREAYNYCKGKGASLTFLCLPFLDDLAQKSNFEKQIETHIPTTIAKYRDKLTSLKEAGMQIETEQRKPIMGTGEVSFEKIILVSYSELYTLLNLAKFPYICLKNFFETSHEFVEIYGDRNHMTYMGYQYIGYIIFNTIFRKEKQISEYQKSHKFYEKLVNSFILTDDFKEYLNKLQSASCDKTGESGVIVMNCNPFTKGHRYLIETAARQVDNLYILVVEEDKSAFKFADRFEMVKAGVKDLVNVTVLESGQFVISSLTFPEYFTKDSNKTTEFDASKDLYNFCKFIAPTLNATKRFVGEEPLDIVTNQYNEQMKKMLPENGVELIVIPRKETNGIVISATRGRKYIQEKDMDGIRLIFPDSTIEYLVEKGYI